MTFQELNLSGPLLRALEDLKFTVPTTIQHRVFSVVMSGRDVCGIAQTGTGKTFAYLLPCLRQWKFDKNKQPQILVLVPTRELVVQVVDAVKQLTPYMSVVAVGIFGGVNINTQQAEIERTGADVLVATPGRLFDLIMNGAFKTKQIKRLVIDEMDEMLDLGFRKQITNILELLPAKRQNLLFSATITDDVEQLMQHYFNDPVRVEAAPAGTPLEHINQSAYLVPNFNTKVNLLDLLLSQDQSMSKVLIFVASRSLADELYDRIAARFEGQIGVIHSNKEQNYRFNVVNQFKSGVFKYIISTDIMARGIDVAEVTHVINFDLPETPENYIHRIGRTGRADKKGISISFISPKEELLQQSIETYMQKEISIQSLPDPLEISDELTEFEKPVVKMKIIEPKLPRKEESGPAFHEKLAKNKKVNKRVSHKERMHQKYGKPKTRGAKKR